MAEFLLSMVFWIIHWVIVLPVALVVATPYVLVAAMFRAKPYGSAVRDEYRRICRSFAEFWEKMGYGFTP